MHLSLPVITLTKEQGEWLTKELYRKVLLDMGVNRNPPWTYQHVSKIFKGMGLPEIMVEKTIVMVSYSMMYGIVDMLIGEAMRS